MEKYQVDLTKDPQKQETTLTVTQNGEIIISDTLSTGEDFYMDVMSTFFYLYDEDTWDSDLIEDWDKTVANLKTIHPALVDTGNTAGVEFKYYLMKYFAENNIKLPLLIKGTDDISDYFKIHEEGFLQRALDNLYDDTESEDDFETIETYITNLQPQINKLIEEFNQNIQQLIG